MYTKKIGVGRFPITVNSEHESRFDFLYEHMETAKQNGATHYNIVEDTSYKGSYYIDTYRYSTQLEFIQEEIERHEKQIEQLKQEISNL